MPFWLVGFVINCGFVFNCGSSRECTIEFLKVNRPRLISIQHLQWHNKRIFRALRVPLSTHASLVPFHHLQWYSNHYLHENRTGATQAHRAYLKHGVQFALIKSEAQAFQATS